VERYNDYLTIMLGLTFTRNYKLTDHDHILWFGDLNYRISMPNEYCRNLIEKGAFDELLEADQLVLEMSNKGAFAGFEEEPVKFYPTYKFDKGTSNYDTSEKQRVPSWTDRIVHRSNVDKGNLRQLNYHSIMDFFLSDHKPVYALFQCKVKFVDEPKRAKMAKELYVSYKQDHDGSGSLLELDDALSSSVLSSSDRFSMEILSEMNLIDDIPNLPQRPVPATAKSPPRRVPPPPPPLRLTANGNNVKDKPIPRKLPPPLTSPKGDVPPPAPPSRRTTISQPAPSRPPLGFSTVPLVPGRSNSGTPNSAQGASSTSSPAIVSPLVPSKPASLSSYKPPAQTQKKPSPAQSSEQSTGSTKRSNNSSPMPAKSLSEWAPLVPK
jgi:inositol-1,4,5-trisphosphate 5-phosphatase